MDLVAFQQRALTFCWRQNHENAIRNNLCWREDPFWGGFKCYFPWENRWMNVERGAVLPDFTRSIVVRIPNRSFE